MTKLIPAPAQAPQLTSKELARYTGIVDVLTFMYDKREQELYDQFMSSLKLEDQQKVVWAALLDFVPQSSGLQPYGYVTLDTYNDFLALKYGRA